MIHGAGGGGWQWSLWAGVCAAQGLQVLAPDLRPGGRGLEDTGFADYLQQVQDWRALAGRTGGEVLVGASLGGLLALAAAAQRPPDALVLVNPVPPHGIEPWPEFKPRPARVVWSRLPFSATRAALPDACLPMQQHAHRRWRDESGRVLAEVAAGIAIGRPSCPVLVLASEHDDDIPPATSRATAAWLAADFALLHGSSHVGALLGHGAAAAAELAVAWLHRARPGNPA